MPRLRERLPRKAIKDGQVNITACMGRCIQHSLLPPTFLLPLVKRIVAGSKIMTRFMELISLNFFETYGIKCTACLKACIYFPGNKSVESSAAVNAKKGKTVKKVKKAS